MPLSIRRLPFTTLALGVLFLGLVAAAVAADSPPAAPTVVNPQTGGVNYWALTGMLGNVVFTNVVMLYLKKLPQWATWEKTSWLPLAVGTLYALLGALASGAITDPPSLLSWLVSGLASGGLAAKARDAYRDFRPEPGRGSGSTQ